MSEPLYRSRPGAFDIRPASQTEATRVADGIWLSERLSNSYLVVTPAGRVVINTGMGFEAPVHKRNFDAVDRGPVRYILLTQAHVDHVGGVDVFRARRWSRGRRRARTAAARYR
jgi:glyoxylase-like metal-dependent hydrolase (beta-lactamase superfamily II)